MLPRDDEACDGDGFGAKAWPDVLIRALNGFFLATLPALAVWEDGAATVSRLGKALPFP